MEVKILGLTKFQDTYKLQTELVHRRFRDEITDTLLITEHYPVITIGRNGNKNHILSTQKEQENNTVPIFYTNRGGDVTVHSPGQLVCYPIFHLGTRGKDVHQYIRNLEAVVIKTLTVYGINSSCRTGYTGVWVGGKKICSLGIGVRRWITFHGISLNVNPDLSYYTLIVPCGIKNVKITSVSQVLTRTVTVTEVIPYLVSSFQQVFGN